MLFRACELAADLVVVGCELRLYPHWYLPPGGRVERKSTPVATRGSRRYPVENPVGEARRLVRARLRDAAQALQAGGRKPSVEELIRRRKVSARLNPYCLRHPEEMGPRETRIREAFGRLRKVSSEKAPGGVRKCRDIAEWPALREDWVGSSFRRIPQLIGSRASDDDLADEWLAAIVALIAVSIRAADSFEEAVEELSLG